MDAGGGAMMEPACASGSGDGGQYCSHSKRINELISELGGRKRKLLEEGLAKLNATEDAKRHGDVSRDVTGDLAQQ
jgi:hypothetical protein